MSINLDLFSTGTALPELLTSLPAGTTRHWIPEGTPGIADTIAKMQKLVSNYKREIKLREWIGKILNPEDGVRPCESKDYFCYAKKLYERVIADVLYVYDPYMVEFIERPSALLKARIGDCDSQDVLLVAAFESLGFPAQFVTVKADPQAPTEYTHVFTRVKLPGIGWVAADPTMPKKWFGWEPPPYMERRYWPGSTDELSHPIDTSPCAVIDQDGKPAGVENGSWVPTGITGMNGMNCGSDYSANEWAPNSYPLGMSGLGADAPIQVPPGIIDLFWQIYNGELIKKIVRMETVWRQQSGAFQAMPEGPPKVVRRRQMIEARDAINALVNKYNEAASMINVAAGTMNFKGDVPLVTNVSSAALSGLGVVFAAIPATYVIVFITGTVGLLGVLYLLVELIQAATGKLSVITPDFDKNDGVIPQTKDLLKTVGIGLGLLLIYRHRRDIKEFVQDTFGWDDRSSGRAIGGYEG